MIIGFERVYREIIFFKEYCRVDFGETFCFNVLMGGQH